MKELLSLKALIRNIKRGDTTIGKLQKRVMRWNTVASFLAPIVLCNNTVSTLGATFSWILGANLICETIKEYNHVHSNSKVWDGKRGGQIRAEWEVNMSLTASTEDRIQNVVIKVKSKDQAYCVQCFHCLELIDL